MNLPVTILGTVRPKKGSADPRGGGFVRSPGWHGARIFCAPRAGGGSRRNVTVLRIISTLLLLTPWFMSAASGADHSTLVEVYCQHVVQKSTGDWSSLVAHLESPSTVVDGALVQSPEFTGCVSENAAFFSTADFLHQGREVIREAARASGTAADNGVRVAVADSDFEMPMVGTVTVGSQQPTLSRAVDPYGYVERSKRYDELWQEFLAGLKSRLNRRAGEQQVAKNTD